jgi:hypothetical protein
LLLKLEEGERSYPAERLRAFSASAALALRLNSVFFMSALLFPEDHRPGTPDDLTLLAEETRRLFAPASSGAGAGRKARQN